MTIDRADRSKDGVGGRSRNGGTRTEGLVFETARRSDLPALIALLADDPLGVGRERPGEPPDPCYVAAFDAIAADPNQQLVVVRPGPGEPACGCLQLSFLPGLSRAGAWRGQIESVRIARAWRDRGIGRELFEWAIARCRERGCALLQLTTDRRRTDASRFYESLGFVASHLGMKLDLADVDVAGTAPVAGSDRDGSR